MQTQERLGQVHVLANEDPLKASLEIFAVNFGLKVFKDIVKHGKITVPCLSFAAKSGSTFFTRRFYDFIQHSLLKHCNPPFQRKIHVILMVT